MIKSLLTFLFIGCTVLSFADKKNSVSVTLDDDKKVAFDYAFMEGIRYKVLGDFKSALSYFDQCMKIDHKSAAVRYELASILVLTDNLDIPLKLMREAVELESSNIWYKILLANILEKKSMIDQACVVYDELIKQYPEREDFYLIETNLLTSVEKWEEAIAVLDRYEKQFGPSEISSVEKVKLYAKAKNIKKASSEILKLIKKYPGKSDYLGLLAELYLSNDQEKKGLQILNKLMERDPSNGFVLFYLTDYYLQKKDTLHADIYLRKALLNDNNDNNFKVQYLLKLLVNSSDSFMSDRRIHEYMGLLLEKYDNDLTVRTLYADLLRKDNKLKESANELEFVLSKDKNNYLIWEELLLLYSQLGDTVLMYDRGKECMEYFPNQPLPYAMVSLPLMIQKKYEDALVYLNKGLELSPENSPMKAQFYAYLGESFYVLDSVGRAFKMFDEVLKINPNDIMTLNNYSYYLSIRNERLNDAERMSAKTVSADPNNPTFLDTYAWVLFKQKSYSLAKYYMNIAIEKSQSPSAVLYEHYGDILYMNGEKEEAVKMWKKALELGGEELSSELENKIEHGLLIENEK